MPDLLNNIDSRWTSFRSVHYILVSPHINIILYHHIPLFYTKTSFFLIICEFVLFNCKCCQYKRNHLYSYSLYIVECMFSLKCVCYWCRSPCLVFGLKFAHQTSGKQVNKAYRPDTYILREKNVWYDMAIWTQNVYYTKWIWNVYNPCFNFTL